MWYRCRVERLRVHDFIKDRVREDRAEELKGALKAYQSALEDQANVHADVNLAVLRGAQVVGMTTSGVASKQQLVAALAPKVFFLCVGVGVGWWGFVGRADNLSRTIKHIKYIAISTRML